MTDRNGTALAIGDRVRWIGMDDAPCVGWVRQLGTCPYRKIPVVVVDDGDRDNPDLATNGFHEARVLDAPDRVVRVADAP